MECTPVCMSSRAAVAGSCWRSCHDRFVSCLFGSQELPLLSVRHAVAIGCRDSKAWPLQKIPTHQSRVSHTARRLLLQSLVQSAFRLPMLLGRLATAGVLHRNLTPVHSAHNTASNQKHTFTPLNRQRCVLLQMLWEQQYTLDNRQRSWSMDPPSNPSRCCPHL